MNKKLITKINKKNLKFKINKAFVFDDKMNPNDGAEESKFHDKTGISVNEYWNMDYILATFIYQRMVYFRYKHKCHPDELTSAEYDKILDKIIKAFDILSTDRCFSIDDKNDGVIQEGLDLFAKYFRSFWSL